MSDQASGKLEPDLAVLTSSGSTATDDPNATVPHLNFSGRGPAAAGEARPFFDAYTAESTGARYRILGPLGEGGMGVVYRAEDTRLGRTVAIKTIPAERTTNGRAKERFLAEARAASALDHPNLCTVYEIEETPEGQLYLFMPCYDGETLRSRLQRGPLPLAEAVHLAQQVARGLAKAHRQGIIHCDIKPANLMLTADGIVKVVDFGIARLSGQASPSQSGPYGTPKYRSPEQARGDAVQAASDIWSLGIVFYEMVTGQPPRRDERGEISWGESARRLPGAPPELAAVLSRMLANHPAGRYPHAAALLADLDRLEERIGGATLARPRAHWREKLLALGLGTVMVCLALAGGYLLSTRRAAGKQPTRVLQPTLVQLTDFPGKTSYPSLSPDGRTVLYVRIVSGRSHIFAQPAVRGADAVDLTAGSPADDTQPAFSPDGKQIAFRSERGGGGIFLMSARGDAVRRLTDFGFHPAWSPDGKQIACSTAGIVDPRVRRTDSEVFGVDIATGARKRMARGDAAQPSWSPHGQRIAYWGVVEQTGRRVIWTVPAKGGEPIPAVDDGHLNWSPVWSPDGRYLYFASDRNGIMNLWRIAIDEESGETRGVPEPVTASQQASMLPSLSRDGRRIAYASDGSRSTIEKVGFDPATGGLSWPAAVIVQTSGVIIESPASPDGNWLGYQLLAPREELFIVHPDGSGRRRLLGDEHKNRLTQFSPDGSRLAVYSNRSGKYEIWTIGVDGRGLRQETSIPGELVTAPFWSADGRELACNVGGRAALIDLARPLAERIPRFLPSPDGGSAFVVSSWSFDGRWLAGARQPKGRPAEPGILLYSLPERKYVRSTSRGESLLWLHDNRRLLYSDGGNLLLLDTRTGTSRTVLPSPLGASYSDLSLSPDDRTLYLARIASEGHIWLLTPG